MKIEVRQGVLARKLDKGLNDVGFIPLSAGTYESAGPIENGYLPIQVNEERVVFIPLDKLSEYVQQDLVVLSPAGMD